MFVVVVVLHEIFRVTHDVLLFIFLTHVMLKTTNNYYELGHSGSYS